MKGERVFCLVCKCTRSKVNQRRHEKYHRLCPICMRLRGPKNHLCLYQDTAFAKLQWVGLTGPSGEVLLYVLGVLPCQLEGGERKSQAPSITIGQTPAVTIDQAPPQCKDD